MRKLRLTEIKWSGFDHSSPTATEAGRSGSKDWAWFSPSASLFIKAIIQLVSSHTPTVHVNADIQ